MDDSERIAKLLASGYAPVKPQYLRPHTRRVSIAAVTAPSADAAANAAGEASGLPTKVDLAKPKAKSRRQLQKV